MPDPDCRYACSAFPNCGCTVEALSPPETTITLPTWADCAAKHEKRVNLTALEQFILDNEPAGRNWGWRTDLAALLKEAST